MLFMSTLMIGTLISISALNWMAMWIGLELNLLSFIPLMNKSKNSYSSEASLKYYIIQVLASLLILFAIILSKISNEYFFIMENPAMMIMNSAFLTKMGAAPFHFWFPEIIEGLEWTNALILLTWQKIAPMFLISYNFNSNLYFSSIIILSMIISGIMSWNQLNLKKILVYSSINHIGWMLSSLMINQSIWVFYFFLYSLISMILVHMMKISQSNTLSQLISILNFNKFAKMMFFLNFLSLGGMPPFLGFMPKWLILVYLMENKSIFLALIMVISTMMMLFVYIRISIQSFLMNLPATKIFISPMVKTYMSIFTFINLMGFCLISFLFNFA